MFSRRTLWLAFLLAGCGLLRATAGGPDGAVPEAGRRLRVLTTIPPLHSWTAQVAGDLAEVENLLPGNVGPHEFQFRPRDLEKLRRADLIIANGLGLEAWLEKAIHNNARQAAQRVVRTSAGLESQLIHHLPVFP
ncbi:MAG: metal ABC transporter substrate-binding protein, partial [Verrucomicrobiota bacterium]